MKKELCEIIEYEKKLYFRNPSQIYLFQLWLKKEPVYYRWRFVYYLRKSEYWRNQKGMAAKIMHGIYRRKKNVLGLRLGIEIYEGCFGKGLLLYHGNIVVNSQVKAGCNCKLHGMNCIGNKGVDLKSPVIGDNVEIGWGAGIFGGIQIANDCLIGANAVVLKAINEPNTIWVGTPAQKI